jgi:hypothetical protein
LIGAPYLKLDQWLALERFQICDDIPDLTWIEPKLGHCWMAGDDTFRERFLQVLVLVESAERWRNLQRAFTNLADWAVLLGRARNQRSSSFPLRENGTSRSTISCVPCVQEMYV